MGKRRLCSEREGGQKKARPGFLKHTGGLLCGLTVFFHFCRTWSTRLFLAGDEIVSPVALKYPVVPNNPVTSKHSGNPFCGLPDVYTFCRMRSPVLSPAGVLHILPDAVADAFPAGVLHILPDAVAGAFPGGCFTYSAGCGRWRFFRGGRPGLGRCRSRRRSPSGSCRGRSASG